MTMQFEGFVAKLYTMHDYIFVNINTSTLYILSNTLEIEGGDDLVGI